MAKHAVLQKGDVVTIYDDPISKERPEGKAVLQKHLIDASEDYNPPKLGAGYWQVRFANGDIRDKWVYPD